MEQLSKRKVYEYILDMLKSKNTKVRNMDKYDILIDENDFNLDNIIVEDSRIIVQSFVEYQDEVEELEKQLKDKYDLAKEEQLPKKPTAEEKKEFEKSFNEIHKEEQKNIERLNKNLKQMKKIYNNVFDIYKSNNDVIGNEIIEISNIVKSLSENIERELISKKVNFEYDKKTLDLIIDINETYTLEYDMFDYGKLTAYDELIEIEKKGRVNGFEVEEDVERAYKLIKHSIHDLEIDRSAKKIVSRKLNLKSMIKDYEDIIETIDEDEPLDDIVNSPEKEFDEESTLINRPNIYFPNPANNEQKKIAEYLSRGNVAVQGPPGTGKTHTIVNIVSHLLATGQSVLVVSEKKDALGVIRNKLPKNLQPLAISMLDGDKQTQKETEESLRNIIEMVDRNDPKEMEKKIGVIEGELLNIEKNISVLANKQLNSYIIENKLILLDGEEKTASQWMQSISVENIVLDDCKVITPLVSMEELDFIINQDKDLLRDLVKYHIPTSQIINVQELIAIDNLKKNFLDLDFEKISDQDITLGVISEEFITEPLEALFVRWYENPNDYELDYKELNELKDIEAVKEKYRRNNLRNKIDIPSDIDRDSLEKFLNKIENTEKLNILQKKINAKFDRVVVNGESILNNCKNGSIVLEQLKFEKANKQFDDMKSYFTRLLEVEQNIIDIENIFNHFEKFMKNVEPLKKIGVDLITLEKKDSTFKMLESYNEILKGIEKIDKLNESIKLVESVVGVESKYYLELINTKVDLFNGCLDTDKYTEYYKMILNDEQKYYQSSEIFKIKEKMDKMSDSFYVKYINEEIGITILNYWRDNYIFTEIDKLSDEDFKSQIINLNSKKSSLIKQLIEAKAWKSLILKIGQTEKEAMQTWDSLMRKIGKGTGKTANLNRKKAIIEMKKIQGVIPVWITTRNQVSELFEYSNDNKFDVVIYDESSQSTIEALNVLERGKRKLIVGDNKQISPTQMINKDDAARIRANYFGELEHNLIEYDTTLFDYANAKYPVIQLREHFRCLPEIIEYSNNLQYSGKMVPLRVVNDKDKLKPVVESIYTPDGFVDKNNVNIVEAQKIIEIINNMVKDVTYKEKTIGVISLLGANQAKVINQMIALNFSPDVRYRFDMKAATTSEFQGDERDVIILSMVSARKEGEDEPKIRAITDEMYRQRYNVAASRAKDKMVLVHSIRPENISNKECLRLSLLDFFLNFDEKQSRYEQAQKKFDSVFEEEIFQALNNKGYHVIPQYEVNHYKIDLVVEGIAGKLAIECDGERYHGPEKFEDDMNRQQVLERAGWQFYRIRGRHYFKDKNGTINDLLDYLEKENILPIYK